MEPRLHRLEAGDWSFYNLLYFLPRTGETGAVAAPREGPLAAQPQGARLRKPAALHKSLRAHLRFRCSLLHSKIASLDTLLGETSRSQGIDALLLRFGMLIALEFHNGDWRRFTSVRVPPVGTTLTSDHTPAPWYPQRASQAYCARPKSAGLSFPRPPDKGHLWVAAATAELYDRERWQVTLMKNGSARIQEKALNPDLPVVDPHHHLMDRPVPYPTEKWIADLRSGHKVVASVHMEAHGHYWEIGLGPSEPAGETEYVAKQYEQEREVPARNAIRHRGWWRSEAVGAEPKAVD